MNITIQMNSVTRPDCSESESVINAISGLKQLACIQVTTLITQKGDLRLISSFVQQLSSLELVVFIQNYERSLDTECDFERLADFPVIHHNGCNCSANGERILSFGDYLDDVAIPKKQPVAVLIVNTNAITVADATMPVEIVDMFNDSQTTYPDVVKQQTLQEKDHQTIIHIASA